MAAIKFRRAIGLVKDKTSISFAKASGNAGGELEALVVKSTSHDAGVLPCEKHIEEIVCRTCFSKSRAYSCVISISKRLQKTRDWVVALKSLILVHRLVIEGGKAIREEIGYANCWRFNGLLDLSGFRDESHSDSWNYSEFVRSYALYLGEKVRIMVVEEEGFDDDAERDFGKVKRLQVLLDRVLGCKPVGVARSNKIVIAVLHLVVADSFDIYGDLCERLSSILDDLPEFGFESCALALELYVKSARQIDGLFEYYGMCKDLGVGGSIRYPEVNKVSDDLLKSLEEFLKAKLSNSSEVVVSDSNLEKKESVLMLPLPAMDDTVAGDLIDLEDDFANDMALALFSEPDSPVSDRLGKGVEDWELALVESASDFARESKDPFAASLVVPPPLYVQMADMEKKQLAASLVVPPPLYVQMADMEKKQQQQLWRQSSVTMNGQPRAFYDLS